MLKKYLLNNFIQKDGVYVHHSNANALNTLSKAVVETNYCIKLTKELPEIFLLADQGKGSTEAEKINSFLISNKYAMVERITNSYHFFLITTQKKFQNTFKKGAFI